ncbi:tetratricopeptide repeat protein, partial [Crocosphaera watsonii]
NDNSITHLGYSLGIPIGTFVALQDRFKAKAQFVTTAQPRISEQQQEDINKAIVETEIPNTRAEAKIWIERGGQLWRLKRLDEAVEAFDQAIKQNNPDNVYLAWYGRGQALGSLGQYQAALEAFKQAINAIPYTASLLENEKDNLQEFQSSILQQQSWVYRNLEKYEKALGAIDQAITLSPNNPNLYNEKSGVLYKLERYEEALGAIDQAIKLAPRAAFYNNRGILYREQEQYDLALSDYNQALNINPQSADVYNSRGFLYSHQQKWDLALSDYNQALTINPQLAGVYSNRG